MIFYTQMIVFLKKMINYFIEFQKWKYNKSEGKEKIL